MDRRSATSERRLGNILVKTSIPTFPRKLPGITHPIALALLLLSAACAAGPSLLNSERIEQRFGSYGVEILEQSEALRRSELYSVERSGRVCRTYAVVRFGDVPAEIATIHQSVIDGQSIGTSFKAAGWSVVKHTIHIGNVSVDAGDRGILRLMHLTHAQELAMHVYRLDLERDGRVIHYATVVEVHHPDYLTVPDLRRIYVGASPGASTPAEIAQYEALVQSD